MHPENKLPNHGKQVAGDAQSQIPNVNQQEQQGPATNQGSKGTGPGNHGVKSSQISPGLKSVGGMMKTKSKRERSISVDAGEQKDQLAPVLESDAKEGAIRRKRRCVLEKKQPYSGDEWCSGAETEEEEDKPSTTSHREHGMSCPSLPVESVSGPGLGCSLGPDLRPDQPSNTSQQVVYVFTTSLANSAAEAVMHGHTDSILLFHQQNVPRTKLDQCTGLGKLPSLSEQLSSSSTPPIGTPKSQSGTPRPASVGGVIVGHLTGGNTPSSTGQPDSEVTHVHPGSTPRHNNCVTSYPLGPGDLGPQQVGAQDCGVDGSSIINHPGSGVSPSANPSMLSVHLQSESGQQEGQGTIEGLSKEQLEHRERSLQTLRDIEKLLLRSGASASHGDPVGPNSNPNNGSIMNNNTDGYQGLEDEENNSGRAGSSCLSDGVPPIRGMKKHEEPLQSIISQTQNLAGPCIDETLMVRHHTMPPQHHLSSNSGLDMGPVLGPEGPTPEQIAWRKLQEEYYQEKRRRQEINPHTHPQHFRMISEMGMPGGPHLMMRGPPPPYHSKPGDQQWGPGPINIGGMGGNLRMIDMHQEGPRGPRFLGQMQRGPPGGAGYPGSPGGVLPMEGMGSQRSPRPGMGWLDDMAPNMPGVGPFHGCYASGGPGGPSQQMQSGMDRPLTREEMFHIMEKRQLQGLHRLDLEQLSRQQQQGGLGGPRMMDNPSGPGFPNPGMAGGPPSRGDPMEFPGSRMIDSPIGGGGGSLMREMVDSPLGGNLNINMNLNLHQQQHLLVQKLRERPGTEMASPEDNTRIRAAPNGRGGANKVMVHGPDVAIQFPNQVPFSGGQGDGPFLQQSGSEMFRSEQGTPQVGENSRLSHLPMNTGHKADHAPCHPSDLPINVNSLGSPAMPPPHQLKSPPLSQEMSPLMASPSATGLKSPNQLSSTGPSHPHLSAMSAAGTPSATSMKSPQIMGSSMGLRSPSGSPGHHKSPAMPVTSPRWTASPKTSMASPRGASNSKGVGNGGSNSTETGISLPPRSSTSTPSSQPPNMPFTSSPDAPPSQNPLSLIMSQMSKYAMPTSIPLYHDAIKTIATSDDEMPTDRLLLPGANIQGNMANHQSTQMLLSSQGSMGPHSTPQSPTGIVLSGNQQLSLDHSGPLLSSPNPIPMPVMLGGGGGHPDGIGPCNMSPMHPPSQMGGFPRMQPPLHSPVGSMGQQYPHPSDDILPSQSMHHLSKGGMPNQRPPHPPDSFPSMPIGEGPDLSEVIRPTHTGIPEFDLSRIIPADKPSSTLQYFPKNEAMSQLQQTPHQGHLPHQAPSAQLLKQLSSSGPLQGNTPSSNPHIANLQNMMAEQPLPLQPAHCGLRPGIGKAQGGVRGMSGVMGPGPICHPGHLMGRTGMPQQQQSHHHQQQPIMANSLLQHQSHMSQGTMTPQQHQHNLIAQQNMMMQAKHRGMPIPGEHFGQQGAVLSPQGPMMGPPHPQSAMIGSQGIRQRGLSLDSPLGYGPGSMANMPF